MPLQVTFDHARHLPVQRAQYLVTQLQQRHVEAAMDQVFRYLQPDESAAHDHSAGFRPDGLDAGVPVHPGQKWRTFLQPLTDFPGIRHRSDREDAWQVDSRQRRPDGRRAGRQNQLVVGFGGDLAGLQVLEVHRFAIRGDGDRLAACPGVDGEQLAEGVGRSH